MDVTPARPILVEASPRATILRNQPFRTLGRHLADHLAVTPTSSAFIELLPGCGDSRKWTGHSFPVDVSNAILLAFFLFGPLFGPLFLFATGTRNSPPVSSVGTMIPEEHPSMTTTLKELDSHKTPTTTNIPSGHSTAPSVCAVVVDSVSPVDPELTSIIGYQLEVVTAAPEDSQLSCPAHGKIIFRSEPFPFATCVAIVHLLFVASMFGFAPIEVPAAPSLTKVVDVFPEKASTISGRSATFNRTLCQTFEVLKQGSAHRRSPRVVLRLCVRAWFCLKSKVDAALKECGLIRTWTC